eukprot:scaffold25127_cov49-Attheya_sp.AAC.1
MLRVGEVDVVKAEVVEENLVDVEFLEVGKKKKMKWLRKMKMKRMLKVKRVQGGSCGQYRMSPVEKEDGRMMKKKKRMTRMIEYQRG